ncbi:YwaF family protein [Streptococcus pseudopneumoniae]|uniref:YwaF family protein n=1 Tax=Streptococcus pseudopneumoniae TaxID=257758 RepID=UPI00061C1291|nr:TIGR02206 family membrane protein [Streptococcus pseudopneumoniae]CIN77330.1 major facilitator superfamily permease [Streptococcus pseudopneumoniae]
MNLWDIFFTTQATEPPKFDLFWYVSIFTLLALTFYTAYRYREKKVYQRFFQSLQAVQLILLYGWYWVNHMPLSESLPFYHCRMAMFVVLLLPGQSKYRQYFALLGTFGTLAAFVYPVPDAYPFPHIAILSFIFGHLALLGNSLVYLLRQYNERLLDMKGIFLMTFALNALIFVVNLVTGGDYGFLTKPPLVGDHGLVANYLIVSLALAAAIALTKKILELFLEQEAEKMIAKKA